MRPLHIVRNLLTAAVIAMPGMALAQVVIDGVQIRPDDLPRVRSQCEELGAQTRASMIEDQGADLLEPSPDPANPYSRGASTIDNVLSDFDLDRLTPDKCRKAGFL